MKTREREIEDRPPHDPEPMAELQKRFQFVLSGRAATEHIFDFEDGLRLVLSRAAFHELKVSASYNPGSEMAFWLVRLARAARSESARHGVRLLWYRAIEVRFRELSGCTGPFELIGVSPTGTPHWIVS